MKKIDLKDKKEEELLEMLSESRDTLKEGRFQVAGSMPKGSHKIREAKRMVAKVLTELTRRKS